MKHAISDIFVLDVSQLFFFSQQKRFLTTENCEVSSSFKKFSRIVHKIENKTIVRRIAKMKMKYLRKTRGRLSKDCYECNDKKGMHRLFFLNKDTCRVLFQDLTNYTAISRGGIIPNGFNTTGSLSFRLKKDKKRKSKEILFVLLLLVFFESS